MRQEKFEEVMRESQRQEVRVQECMGITVSEAMSESDERLRGVLRGAERVFCPGPMKAS